MLVVAAGAQCLLAKEGSPHHQRITATWPPPQQLAALLVMVGHARHFEPQRLGDKQYSCPRQLMEVRAASRAHIEALISWWPSLSSHIQPLEERLAVRKSLIADEDVPLSIIDSQSEAAVEDETASTA